MACVALALVAGLSIAAVAAPLLAPYDPDRLHLDRILQTSGRHHWLGTDQSGRDVLSRLIYGARWSLGGALLVTIITTATGVTLGAACGLIGGVIDTVVMRVVDSLLAFPSLLLALTIVAVTGPGLTGVLVALASVGWAGYARVVRGLVLSLREREYVDSARVAGATGPRLFVHHLLPNIASPVVVLATLEIGQLILALAGLSFLGLGAQSPTPEWGVMISEGRTFLFRAPRLMVFPGIAITLAVLGTNLLGDRLRDLLDPRLGSDTRRTLDDLKLRDG